MKKKQNTDRCLDTFDSAPRHWTPTTARRLIWVFSSSDTYLFSATYLGGRDTEERVVTTDQLKRWLTIFKTSEKRPFFSPSVLESVETYRLASRRHTIGGGLERETSLSHELVSEKSLDELWKEEKCGENTPTQEEAPQTMKVQLQHLPQNTPRNPPK